MSAAAPEDGAPVAPVPSMQSSAPLAADSAAQLKCVGACATPVLPPPALVCYACVPSSMRINDFVRHGYRRHPSTTLNCLRSVFSLHNETFNVWSHGYAAAVCFSRVARDVASSHPKAKMGPHHLAMTASGSLFLASATAHMMSCHSEHTACTLFKVDRSVSWVPFLLLAVHFGTFTTPPHTTR